ncbi:MAG TPA: hypothetical protein VEA19_03855 [Actinomycetota bacterium]|nr:hypothetical protein [Actinomycetota bacterium]
MRRGVRLRRPAIAGFAIVGSLAGHALAYAVAIRDPAHRSAHLWNSGHGYWRAAVWLGWAVAFATIAWVFVKHVRGEGYTLREPVLRNAAVLTALQATGFLVLETSERLATGAPLTGLLHHRLALVGILAQIVIALLGALFLRWLAGAAAKLAELLRAARPSATVPLTGSARDVALTLPPLAGAISVRGPPVLLPS